MNYRKVARLVCEGDYWDRWLLFTLDLGNRHPYSHLRPTPNIRGRMYFTSGCASPPGVEVHGTNAT